MKWVAVPRGVFLPACVVTLACGHHRVLYGSADYLATEKMTACGVCVGWSSIKSIWQIP